jgi:hypothetical protein
MVTWQEPSPEQKGVSWIGLRLVRNQNAYAETPEDGVTVWSWSFIADGTSEQNRVQTSLIDGYDYNEIPLSVGRYVYYSMWLQKNDGSWSDAGKAFTIVPSPHGTSTLQDGTLITTHDKVMDLLPRVFTSASQSPIDEVDKNSLLYSFVQGFSFTFDEMLTFADLLIPDSSGRNINPNIAPSLAEGLGVTYTSTEATKRQKRLIRDAIYTYSRKGTKASFGTLAENVTGFAPTIVSTPNLMLSAQDATFYKGVGSWSAVGNCVLTAVDTVFPATGSMTGKAIDFNWTGKVVASTSEAGIQNGTYNPMTHGVPVTAGTSYDFSFNAKSAATSPVMDVELHWYDFQGNLISASDSSTEVSITGSWARYNVTKEAPAGAKWVGFMLRFDVVGTYYLDMIQLAPSLGQYAYYEPRGFEMLLRPEKINFIHNPSFENSTDALTGWAVSGATATAVSTTLPNVPSGNKMLRLVGNSSGGGSLTLNKFTSDLSQDHGYYTLSFYAKGSANLSVATGFTIYDSTESNNVYHSETFNVTTDWQRFSLTVSTDNGFYGPIDPTTMKMTAVWQCAGLNGKTLYIDSVMIEDNYSATDYFDGNLPVTSGALWYGTAHDSESVYYPDWPNKTTLLTLELQNNIPSNTPWRINLYGVSTTAYEGITP